MESLKNEISTTQSSIWFIHVISISQPLDHNISPSRTVTCTNCSPSSLQRIRQTSPNANGTRNKMPLPAAGCDAYPAAPRLTSRHCSHRAALHGQPLRHAQPRALPVPLQGVRCHSPASKRHPSNPWWCVMLRACTLPPNTPTPSNDC